MVDQLDTSHWLYQQDTAAKVQHLFGASFTYFNSNGNLAIGKDVLREFKKLTGNTVVWERGQRAWRRRKEHDQAGRQQH
jgi:hypothetical protein